MMDNWCDKDQLQDPEVFNKFLWGLENSSRIKAFIDFYLATIQVTVINEVEIKPFIF